MMNKKRLLVFGLLILILLAGFGLRYRSVIASELNDLSSKLQTLIDIYQLINIYYVDEVDPDALIKGAIRGMAEELDPYSAYLEPDEYEDLQNELLEGVFGGIGIVITIRDGQLTIVSPIKDTPGEAAGLQSGDIILEVDGKSTEGISTQTAASWMRGDVGTQVTIKVQREGEEPKIYDIIRGLIEQSYLDYEIIDDKIGYLNLYQFGAGSGRDVADALEDLTDKGIEGVILDLRSNPGGLLNEAVNVASNFISKGPIVHVRQRGDKKETLYVNRFIKRYDLPLIVLVNGGSASASEIVAGAIQDTGIGTLLGTTTFGKGTVQQIIPLKDESAIKITIARYYTPNDRFIHEDGIDPDVVEEFDVELYTEKNIDNQLEKAVRILKGEEIDAEESLKPAM